MARTWNVTNTINNQCITFYLIFVINDQINSASNALELKSEIQLVKRNVWSRNRTVRGEQTGPFLVLEWGCLIWRLSTLSLQPIGSTGYWLMLQFFKLIKNVTNVICIFTFAVFATILVFKRLTGTYHQNCTLWNLLKTAKYMYIIFFRKTCITL